MKYFHKLVLSAALVIASSGASLLADTFSFSYAFNDAYGSGGIFNGKLSGTQVGDSVTGTISDLAVQELYVNGNQITGPIFNSSYDSSFGVWLASGSAVVSFDQNLNNFLFINSDYGSGDGSFTGYAYLVNGSGIGAATAQDLTLDTYSGDFGDGSWSLTVPENGTTVGLLGLALVGFAAMRRRITAR